MWTFWKTNPSPVQGPAESSSESSQLIQLGYFGGQLLVPSAETPPAPHPILPRLGSPLHLLQRSDLVRLSDLSFYLTELLFSSFKCFPRVDWTQHTNRFQLKPAENRSRDLLEQMVWFWHTCCSASCSGLWDWTQTEFTFDWNYPQTVRLTERVGAEERAAAKSLVCLFRLFVPSHFITSYFVYLLPPCFFKTRRFRSKEALQIFASVCLLLICCCLLSTLAAAQLHFQTL